MLGPTIVDTRLIAPVGDIRLMCVDLRTELPIWTANGHHCQASVAVEDGVAFYSNGSACYALDLQSGEKMSDLRVKGGGLSFFPQSGPAVHDGKAYFVKGDNRLYAFSVDNKRLKKDWDVPLGAGVRSSVSLGGNVLYYGSDDHHVYARDRATGEELWSFETGDRVSSSAAIHDGVLYIGSEDGKVYALH